MTQIQTGPVRLAILASVGGSISKTLYLPAPSVDGMNLEWARKSSTEEVLDGGERTRVLGYLPVLTCRWSAYDERTGQGYVIGTANGQRPGLEDLLVLLSQPSGFLRVSPGLAGGGFTVDSVTVQPFGRKAGIYTGIQAVFRGRDTLPTMALGAF